MRDDKYRTDCCIMDNVHIGKYLLEFYTREQYWSGSGTQDWPGNFMDNCMYLVSCKEPDPKEIEAIKNKKAVLNWRREITGQPEGYSEFMHQSILKNPEKYLCEIIEGIHKIEYSYCKPPSYLEMKRDLKKYQKNLIRKSKKINP